MKTLHTKSHEYAPIITYEFMFNHKEKKSVFVTCMKEGTQINTTTLRDLSLKRSLES